MHHASFPDPQHGLRVKIDCDDEETLEEESARSARAEWEAREAREAREEARAVPVFEAEEEAVQERTATGNAAACEEEAAAVPVPPMAQVARAAAVPVAEE